MPLLLPPCRAASLGLPPPAPLPARLHGGRRAEDRASCSCCPRGSQAALSGRGLLPAAGGRPQEGRGRSGSSLRNRTGRAAGPLPDSPLTRAPAWAALPTAPESAPLTQRLLRGLARSVGAAPAGLDRMPPAPGVQGQVTGPGFRGFTGSGWAGPPPMQGGAQLRCPQGRGQVPPLPAPRALRVPRSQRGSRQVGCSAPAATTNAGDQRPHRVSPGGRLEPGRGGAGGSARPVPSGWRPRALASCAGSV